MYPSDGYTRTTSSTQPTATPATSQARLPGSTATNSSSLPRKWLGKRAVYPRNNCWSVPPMKLNDLLKQEAKARKQGNHFIYCGEVVAHTGVPVFVQLKTIQLHLEVLKINNEVGAKVDRFIDTPDDLHSLIIDTINTASHRSDPNEIRHRVKPYVPISQR